MPTPWRNIGNAAMAGEERYILPARMAESPTCSVGSGIINQWAGENADDQGGSTAMKMMRKAFEALEYEQMKSDFRFRPPPNES